MKSIQIKRDSLGMIELEKMKLDKIKYKKEKQYSGFSFEFNIVSSL